MRTASPYPMIEVRQALARILACARPLPIREVPFLEAQGMILAEDVFAAEALPDAPRSAVDGYAVTTQPNPTTLDVLGELTAGQVSDIVVDPASAARIMTGGLLPAGADSVVMVEDTRESDGRVDILKPAPAGANVTPAGHDLRAGQLVLHRGTRLGPPELGMLATVGAVRPRVYARPKVAVLATGDELVPPDQVPRPGTLRDSNRFALIAAAREAGAEVVWAEHRTDDREALREALETALSLADVLVTSGGVSMGTRDLIKPLLAELGDMQFGRIAFKPGKPLTFVTVGEKLAFGLPGYPVSSLVTFEVFVRPALLRLQGLERVERPRVLAALEHPLQPDRARLEYQRAVVRWNGERLVASSTGVQSSSRLASMVGANALLEIPAGNTELPAGQPVTALLTAEILG
jgi:molybdopterin molybdotransferase